MATSVRPHKMRVGFFIRDWATEAALRQRQDRLSVGAFLSPPNLPHPAPDEKLYEVDISSVNFMYFNLGSSIPWNFAQRA